MRDRIEALKLFVRTAQTRSFSQAGRELGMSQPVASRAIAALERDLGAALFTRTTRAVVPTDAGREFLVRIEEILGDLDEAYEVFSEGRALRGVLRLGMSSSFAIREIIPRLPNFLLLHPALKLELLTSDKREDLVLEGVDVALRLGKLPDSVATTRHLGQWPRSVLASPDYLVRSGRPQKPEDLHHHQIIAGPTSNLSGWTFRQGDREVTIKPASRITATLNEAAIAAAVAGLGIAVTGVNEAFVELRSGQLKVILQDWTLDPIDVQAVYPAGKASKPAARAFVDFLVDDLHRS